MPSPTHAWLHPLFILLLLVAACGPSESDGPEELSFNVDPALLGDAFTEDGFTVRPPAGWNASPHEALAEANALLRTRAGGAVASTLVALFRDDDMGGHMTVGRYGDHAGASRDSIVSVHGKRLRESARDGDVRQARFSHSGCEIDQFMIMDPQTVVVTLFAYHPRHPLYQLDYAVPRESYEVTLAALESSIGSITFDP